MSDVTVWMRPDARQDVVFSLDADSITEGDTILSCTTAVVTSGSLTVDEGTLVETNTGVLVWIDATGTSSGETAVVRCSVVTAQGRKDTKEIGITIGYHS